MERNGTPVPRGRLGAPAWAGSSAGVCGRAGGGGVPPPRCLGGGCSRLASLWGRRRGRGALPGKILLWGCQRDLGNGDGAGRRARKGDGGTDGHSAAITGQKGRGQELCPWVPARAGCVPGEHETTGTRLDQLCMCPCCPGASAWVGGLGRHRRMGNLLPLLLPALSSSWLGVGVRDHSRSAEHLEGC